jgi:hypothetical protein
VEGATSISTILLIDVKVEGATSISTILLVDVKVESFPPYKYVSTPSVLP